MSRKETKLENVAVANALQLEAAEPRQPFPAMTSLKSLKVVRFFKKTRVTPSVAAPGDTYNPSNATAFYFSPCYFYAT